MVPETVHPAQGHGAGPWRVSVKSFTGTSTGSTYNVGQQYSTSRGVVEAQADGTFKNVSTGQKSAGSSEAVRVAETFRSYGSSDSGASDGYSGGKQSVKVQFSGGPAHGGSGSGAGQVQSAGGRSTVQRGAGAPVVASQAGFFSGFGDDFKTTALYWGGGKLNLNFSNSDGGDFEDRWGEWGGALAGLGVMAADYQHMAASEMNRQKASWEKTAAEAQAKEILMDQRGKPHGMTEANWLQSQLNQYAREQALIRMHEPEMDGLSSLGIGNPHKPGNFFDFGSWWK